MPLPTKQDAVNRIRELADGEHLELSKKAEREMARMGYKHHDICDMLYEVDLACCEKVEPSHRDAEKPVVTFVTDFLSREREERELPSDRLFVEVMINPDSLYLLACKLDGSPE